MRGWSSTVFPTLVSTLDFAFRLLDAALDDAFPLTPCRFELVAKPARLLGTADEELAVVDRLGCDPGVDRCQLHDVDVVPA